MTIRHTNSFVARRTGYPKWPLLAGLWGSLVSVQSGCRTSECARPDYSQAECRVVAENELARILTPNFIEYRFQTPESTSIETWHPTGHFRIREDGWVDARSATVGELALSIENRATESQSVQLRLRNVAQNTTLRIVDHAGNSIADWHENRVTLALTREIELEIPPAATYWIRGTTPCPDRMAFAVLGDIQNNPVHFERILERIDLDAAELQSQQGVEMLAILLLGDLSETAAEPELRAIEQLLLRSTIPVVTVPGNHDIYSRRTPYYNRIFGPGNYAFDVCGTRFALFDTGNGGLADSVEGRIEELLFRGPAEFLIAGMHHPPYAGLTGAGWSREDQAEYLLAQAAHQRVDLVLAGHVHAVLHYPQIPVGNRHVEEIVSGTGGAEQGLGLPTYGYLRLLIGEQLETCFAEVPPPGTSVGHGVVPKSIGKCVEGTKSVGAHH